MKPRKDAKSIAIIMVSLSLSACHSSTTSATAWPSPPSGRTQQNMMSFVRERKPMSAADRQQHANANRGLKLYPVDEGSQDRSFKIFREELLKAAAERDVSYVLSVVSPHILNNLGGDGGVEEFKQQWKLDHPDSELWDTLTAILSNGGSFEVDKGEKLFCAPYASSQWRNVIDKLPDDADDLDYAAITDRNIELRQSPNSNALVLASLSYDVVKVGSRDSVFDASLKDGYTWMNVTTLSGIEGYVSAKHVHSSSDFHACFKKAGGKWVMTILSGGD